MTGRVVMVGSRSCWKELHGSGKTEVYLHLVGRLPWLWEKLPLSWFQKFLWRHKWPIVSSPFWWLEQQSSFEAPKMVKKNLTSGVKVRSGQAKVVVGARSAIFAPVGQYWSNHYRWEYEATYKAILAIMLVWPCLSPKSWLYSCTWFATPSIDPRARAQKSPHPVDGANPSAKFRRLESGGL